MSVYLKLKINKPWLYLPASWTHFLSPLALKVYSRLLSSQPCQWEPFHWKQMYFSNPLGTAGGVDKNACHVQDWQSLGAGFLELGTITPEAQKANPSKILDRSLKYRSLWNNMGFPNKGMEFVRQKLLSLPETSPVFKKSFSDSLKSVSQGEDFLNVKQQLFKQALSIPLFINIGKNRETPLSSAFMDYKKTMTVLHPFAGAFVINISSPNTKDLRELFDKKTLPHFLKSLKDLVLELDSKASEGIKDSGLAVGQDLKASKGIESSGLVAGLDSKASKGVENSHTETPLILKLSPDEEEGEILRIIEQSIEAGISAWCICNSTKERLAPGIFPDRGGVSGRLLGYRSLNLLRQVKKYLVDNKVEDKLLISCGGVLTAQDVLNRLQEGADLVQVYSALVFEGPSFFQSVCKEIRQEELEKGNQF